MKNFYLLLIAFIFIITGCKEEQFYEEIASNKNKMVTVKAYMPIDSQVSSRLALTPGNNENITLTWENGDTIYLTFEQEETLLSEKVVIEKKDISSDGKSVKFAIALPGEIKDGNFNLYGIHGGGGIIVNNPAFALLPENPGLAESLESVQERNDIMLTFSSIGISTANPEVSIVFNHLGSLFSIILKNTGDSPLNNLANVRLVSESEGWAYNSGKGGNKYNLLTKEFSGIENAGSFISFKSSVESVEPGESISVLGWYPILPDVIWPEIKLELINKDGNVINMTSNSHPDRTTATLSGQIYYFFASVNNDKLIFTNNLFQEIPEFDNFTLLEYIEQVNDPLSMSVSKYLEIANYTGLVSDISMGNKTRIVPTNNAVNNLINELGGVSIGDIPKNVLREYFTYLIIDGNIVFQDIPINDSNIFSTNSGDNIHFFRDINGLYINKDNIFTNEPIKVIGHDYSFKDGTVHFVDVVPYYNPIIKRPDSAPETVELDYNILQTIDVVADNYVNKISPNTVTVRSNNWQNQVQLENRHSFLKFDLPARLDVNDFTVAHLEVTSYDVRGTDHIIGLYEVTDNSWKEENITYNSIINSIGDEIDQFGTLEKRKYSINVTNYINKNLSMNNFTISFALQMISGIANSSGFNFVCFHDREAINDVSRNGSGPSLVFGEFLSELLMDQNQTLSVRDGYSGKFTKSNISMKAPVNSKYKYSDNNIIYVISSTPSNGNITLFGKPINVGDRFTQAELNAGLLKYVYDDSGHKKDSLILNVRDYVGGVYPDSITINIDMNVLKSSGDLPDMDPVF